MITNKQITFIVNKIKQIINPDKIYLFGSYAYGKPNKNSDLDLLIIKNGITDKRKQLVGLKKDIISKDYSVDILIYSEYEFNKKKEDGWTLFNTIAKKGKLLYAA